MTWDKSRGGRWRKVYRGRAYYVSCRELGVPDSKEASYGAANAWWRARQAELEGQAKKLHPHAGVLEELGRRKAWADRHTPEAAPHLRQQIEWVEGMDDDLHPSVVRDFLGSDAANAVWRDRLTRDDAEPIPEDRTVGGRVVAFIALQRTRLEAGDLSVSEYDTIRRCLHAFRDWIGSDAPIERIDADRWEAWWGHLLGSARSIEYKKKRLATARNFIGWLSEKGLIARPPNLQSRRYRFGAEQKVVKVMTPEEVRTLVDAAPLPLKLHLLLMANTGMTQGDLSKLRPDEVDWDAGRIRRSRSKTRDKSAPVVDYLLWPQVAGLLRQHGRREGERVFLTPHGKPLVRDEMIGEKRSKTDSVDSAFDRLRKATKVDKSLRVFRSTGASLLETHEVYGRYAQYFLGHKPRSVAERHYVRPAQERFDDAVTWLGRELGLVT